MSHITIKALSIAVLLATHVAAAAGEATGSYYTYAPVVDVQPVVREHVTTVPVERCRIYRSAERIERDPYLRHQDDHYRPSPLRGLIGGLVGGFVGNQFGGGRGKTALTIAGAIAGAKIAKHTGRSNRKPVRRCAIEYEHRTVEGTLGYDVTYRFQGREFTKRTEHYPGERVRIEVDVTPVSTTSVEPAIENKIDHTSFSQRSLNAV